MKPVSASNPDALALSQAELTVVFLSDFSMPVAQEGRWLEPPT